MVLQAYFDESEGRQGTFVIGGFVAEAQKWAELSEAWEKLLPRFGVLADDGKYHFKMSEMNINSERRSRIAPFFREIEKCVICSVIVIINRYDFEVAKNRLFVPGLKIHINDNLYSIAVKSLLNLIYERREMISKVGICQHEKLELIFDDHSSKRSILAAWAERRKQNPELLNRAEDSPIFMDDRKSLPLQAADLWVWCVRNWSEMGIISDENEESFPMRGFSGMKTIQTINAVMYQDQIVNNLRDHALRPKFRRAVIYDISFAKFNNISSCVMPLRPIH